MGIRRNQEQATHREFYENGYVHHQDLHARHTESDQLQTALRSRMGEFRAAGLASINPTLGTRGATADMAGMTGPQSFDKWRKVTPFAIDLTRTKLVDIARNEPC